MSAIGDGGGGDWGGSVDSPGSADSDWGSNMADMADAVGEAPADEGAGIDDSASIDGASGADDQAPADGDMPGAVSGAAEDLASRLAEAIEGGGDGALGGHETYAKPAVRTRPGMLPGG